jgi:hypothetical protein
VVLLSVSWRGWLEALESLDSFATWSVMPGNEDALMCLFYWFIMGWCGVVCCMVLGSSGELTSDATAGLLFLRVDGHIGLVVWVWGDELSGFEGWFGLVESVVEHCELSTFHRT